ncbi:curli production assembly/transport protein CsgE [Shewanella intestini]|uniref:Curli production assembly/transport component CsgE n=1 Tax=Shewanella intestini TaxID=2017544 RepID=A0ABS5HZU3_9GAMM|nr:MULTISPECIES: curli production assembly/transport protein CsgE [Shewanella]MBR9727191.1 curli production assembly/transport component CsgE [Shewanella intestini]MRG35993.1 curli production assembly/transport component CsgE [Shewanella sp. XMDDZSB0408]
MKYYQWLLAIIVISHFCVLADPINVSPAKQPEKTGQADDKYLPQQQDQTVNISDATPRKETDLVDGLILNRAMTRLGHRFYRDFVSAYRDINGTALHTGLTVKEYATARSGSKISILHNRKPIFVTFVSPASRNIDEQALGAAQRVDNVLKQHQRQTKWSAFTDPDLAPDEI